MLFGLSRQAYYKHKKARIERRSHLIKVREAVTRIRCVMPRLGTRKLYYMIKEELESLNIKIGRDVLFDFLRAEHLLIKPKRNYKRTTYSNHWLKKHPDLAKEMTVSGPEQLWVSDITYIKTAQGYEYLSLITDAYSRKIMGYALLDNLSTKGPLEALEMALRNRRYQHPLIHHSDRGLQYCSEEYTDKLRLNNIKISMTENGDPYRNAIAERVNGILKHEFLLIEGYISHLQALKSIKESIGIYNERRPHLSCNMLTPNKAHYA